MASSNTQEILPSNETFDDTSSVVSSIVDSSIVDTLSETDVDQSEDGNDSHQYTNISELPIVDQILDTNSLRKQLEEIMPMATYNNVSVSNSSNVVFGNVIKVKGVLNINLIKENHNQEEKQKENKRPARTNWESPYNSLNSLRCGIVPRNCWQALEPTDEYTYIKGPVDIVIIAHTATESSTSSERNMEFIRNIQTFHIDTQDWGDIGYNFLIGCDGNIYEGRGWGVVGVHTYGYNSRSLCIAFIGSFTRSMPSEKALKSCQDLIKRGIEEGHLTNNYKLLGHRQCIATASPGRLLFEEISKWDNFCNNEVNDASKI